MKKLVIAITALTMATALFAQEETSPKITPYGMAQYRLRLKMFHFDNTAPNTTDSSYSIYRNMISYFVGMSVKINDVVSFGFQAGNNSTTTEEASFFQQKASPIWMSQAWAKFNPGFVNLSFGVLPVNGNGTLDLIERSLNNSGGKAGTYADASQVSWPVGTNASLEGIKLGVPVLRGAMQLDVDLMQAIIANRTQVAAEDPKAFTSSYMFLLNLPFAWNALKLTPEVAFIMNREANQFTGKSDPELALGFTGAYKINETISVTALAATANRDNANTYLQAVNDTTNGIQFEQKGILVGVGASAKIGPGTLNLNVNYSTSENAKDTNSAANFTFVDLKYGFCLHAQAKKNLTIMPRIRLYLDEYKNMNTREIWPEVIFIGKF